MDGKRIRAVHAVDRRMKGCRLVHSVTRRILKSNSTNVYTNLAIEDWLFENRSEITASYN